MDLLQYQKYVIFVKVQNLEIFYLTYHQNFKISSSKFLSTSNTTQRKKYGFFQKNLSNPKFICLADNFSPKFFRDRHEAKEKPRRDATLVLF